MRETLMWSLMTVPFLDSVFYVLTKGTDDYSVTLISLIAFYSKNDSQLNTKWLQVNPSDVLRCYRALMVSRFM